MAGAHSELDAHVAECAPVSLVTAAVFDRFFLVRKKNAVDVSEVLRGVVLSNVEIFVLFHDSLVTFAGVLMFGTRRGV